MVDFGSGPMALGHLIYRSSSLIEPAAVFNHPIG
jgi:hypothetical protein